MTCEYSVFPLLVFYSAGWLGGWWFNRKKSPEVA